MAISFAKDAGPQALVDGEGTPYGQLTVDVDWDLTTGGQKGWSARRAARRGVDLDLAVLVYDLGGNGIRICSGFDVDKLFGGALVHTGDNKTGKGEGPDEAVQIDLDRIPEYVGAMLVTLNAFKKGVTFTNIAGATCTFSEGFGQNQHGLAQLPVPIDDRSKASAFIARIVRGPSGRWEVSQINRMGGSGTMAELLVDGKQYL